ncbi:MAG: hypothetical protein Q9218_006426, partial [Villophora microphyllina]
MSSEIILYDLPSKGRCACWSLNPWKTRLILNYKLLSYTTHWLEYPAVAPFLKSVNMPPNPSDLNPTPYTIPTIRLPDETYIMDSKAIAIALEKMYPNPPLYLDDPMLARVEELWPKLQTTLRGVAMPKIPRNVLNTESVTYFEETRGKRFGMPLSQLEKEVGGEKAWEDAKPFIKEFGEMLRENPEGPFLRGEEVSYADFVVVGALRFME